MTTVSRIKKISPVQLGKMLGVIYGLVSLLIVPVFILFTLIGAAVGASQHGGGGATALGVGFGLIMALAMPILYAAFGFIGGLIGGLVYNVVAKWIGGIEVEIEQIA